MHVRVNLRSVFSRDYCTEYVRISKTERNEDAEGLSPGERERERSSKRETGRDQDERSWYCEDSCISCKHVPRPRVRFSPYDPRWNDCRETGDPDEHKGMSLGNKIYATSPNDMRPDIPRAPLQPTRSNETAHTRPIQLGASHTFKKSPSRRGARSGSETRMTTSRRDLLPSVMRQE